MSKESGIHLAINNFLHTFLLDVSGTQHYSWLEKHFEDNVEIIISHVQCGAKYSIYFLCLEISDNVHFR